MLNEYDVVKLAREIPNSGVPIGTMGTILIVHSATPSTYEVEFVDQEGTTLGILTLTEDALEKR